MAVKGYKYNFSNFMGQCELNYMMLNRLLTNISGSTEFDDESEFIIDDNFILTFKVTERCKYTTCMRFSVTNTEQSSLIPQTGIDLRLYHDAHLVEVVDNKGVAIAPIYPYPNSQMVQKNEKQGVNEFLGEWLSFCLKNGRCTETVTINGTVNRLLAKGE